MAKIYILLKEIQVRTQVLFFKLVMNDCLKMRRNHFPAHITCFFLSLQATTHPRRTLVVLLRNYLSRSKHGQRLRSKNISRT